MKQISLSFLRNYRKEFGGSLLTGRRKERRPLSTKHPIHLVLRSERTGIFNPGNRSLEQIIRKTARRFAVHVYDFALNWLHVHAVIRIRNHDTDNAFIRALTGTIARKAQLSQKHTGKVFSLRPFPRILQLGKGFENALQYQIVNQMEARGCFKRRKPTSPSFRQTAREISRPHRDAKRQRAEE